MDKGWVEHTGGYDGFLAQPGIYAEHGHAAPLGPHHRILSAKDETSHSQKRSSNPSLKKQEMAMNWTLRELRGVALILVGSLGLVACGTATPYQAAVDGKGYAEQAIEEDRYQVTFTGNTLTPRVTTENYLLYRAAEVTLARGFDHFIMVDRDTERTTRFISTTDGFGGFGRFHGFYRGHGFGTAGFTTTTTRPRSSYAAIANIVMRAGEKPSDDVNAYDARDVLEQLSPTITRLGDDL